MDYEMTMRLLLAVLWGGIIGAEREYRSKSAGFRTMIMISMGSCFFTMMSVLMGSGSNSDRIASNILTGIGFLGAGVIFRGDNKVNGITTAATIWAVAAIGMGIGAGHYAVSAAASVLIIIVLAVLPYLEKNIDKLNQSKEYSIQVAVAPDVRSRYETLLKENRLKFRLVKEVKEGNLLKATWQVQGHSSNHQRYIASMILDDTLIKFEY